MKPARDPLAIYNERTKLLATSANAIGIGLIGFAVLRPLTENANSITVMSLWWALAGLAFHAVSHYILGRLRKEPDQ